MTKKEWIQAMLDGKKVVSNQTNEPLYFDSNTFRYESDGVIIWIENHTSGFALYEEPKKMIKVAQYAYRYDEEDIMLVSRNMYKDDKDFSESNKNVIYFKRLDYTEIEVEDY